MLVKCRTNLDLDNESWPSILPAVPQVGDLIQSATVHKDGFRLSLQVVRITWIAPPNSIEWLPEIELGLSNLHRSLPFVDRNGDNLTGSLRAFYHWYAPKVGRTASAFI